MGNLFVNVPVPAANGSGAAVNLSGFGFSKTINVTGSFDAAVTIEISNQLVPTRWAPIATFNRPDGLVVDFAARWVRASVAGYKTGAPACDIGGTDDGTLFASLPVPAGNGAGAAIDTSVLPLFKTVTVGGPFGGNVQLEVSEDGATDWAQLGFGFSNPGQQSQIMAARFMRVVRTGVPVIAPGLPTVDVGACPYGTTGAPIGSTDVTSQWTAIVDPALGNDASGQFGNLGLAFRTIQAALNAIPTPVDGASARTAWTIIVSPGTYDEDLTVDLTGGKHVTLVSWGPWNLGLFDAADWQPSGPARSIAITTANAVVFDSINGSFAIQPMLPANTGDETQVAQVQVPRISGQITTTGVFAATPSIDMTVMAVVYGIANDAIVGGAADINLRVHRSRMRGTVAGTGVVLVDATESRFDDLLDIAAYGRCEECFFGDGMTIVSTSPSSNTTPGFYDCQLQGAFAGPAGSYWFDLVTDYWFKTNGASFAGGATRTVIETMHPMALPEQWAVQNVPANQPSTAMSAQVSTNFDEIRAMRPGSIVGISSRLTEAVTAGLLQVDATINGVVVPAAALNIAMAIGSTGGQTLAAPGVAPYVAGDLIGIKYTTDVAFAPTTTDLEAWLEVLEEIPS